MRKQLITTLKSTEVTIDGLTFKATAWDNQHPVVFREGEGTGLVQVTFESNTLIPEDRVNNIIDIHLQKLLDIAINATEVNKEFYEQFEVNRSFSRISFHLEREPSQSLGVFRAELKLNLKKKKTAV